MQKKDIKKLVKSYLKKASASIYFRSKFYEVSKECNLSCLKA